MVELLKCLELGLEIARALLVLVELHVVLQRRDPVQPAVEIERIPEEQLANQRRPEDDEVEIYQVNVEVPMGTPANATVLEVQATCGGDHVHARTRF